MSEPRTEDGRRITVADLYGPAALPEGEFEAILDASLEPRGPDFLFDVAAELGVTAASDVLDVGCRDGRHLRELWRRFGCAGTGVELVSANLARAPRVVGDAPVALVQGTATALPFARASFDLVWVRDVLIHVEPLTTALAECRRVVRPGGAVLVYQMFATPLLESGDADRLWAPLAAIPRNADRPAFEAAISTAGLRVERREELRSEWREYLEEHDTGRTSRQLLWAARLLRCPDRYKEALGDTEYAIELANSLWGVYQMIGKLSAAVYVLR